MGARSVLLASMVALSALALSAGVTSPASAAAPGSDPATRVIAVPIDYCGTEFFDVPDQTYYFDFGSACQAHDACYTTGGSEADRLSCDQAFLSAMLASCVTKWPIAGPGGFLEQLRNRRICNYYAQLYYFGVRVGGGTYFNYTPV